MMMIKRSPREERENWDDIEIMKYQVFYNNVNNRRDMSNA